jgi:nucleoside-triphosphatase THEP1
VAAVDRLCEHALDPSGVDYLLIDEIGPMQVHSDGFVRRARAVLDDAMPVLTTVTADPGDHGGIADCHAREDARWFEVTPTTRDGLPTRLADAVAREIDD